MFAFQQTWIDVKFKYLPTENILPANTFVRCHILRGNGIGIKRRSLKDNAAARDKRQIDEHTHAHTLGEA